MNHRLKFRLEDGYLQLREVWCPADHGGECDCREVEYVHDIRERPDCWPYADPGAVDAETADDHVASCEDCTAWQDGDCVETGRCWAQYWLNENVSQSDGWQDCLRGDIDLPWVAVTIDTCGPDGYDPVMVHVVAEKEDRTATDTGEIDRLRAELEAAYEGRTMSCSQCDAAAERERSLREENTRLSTLLAEAANELRDAFDDLNPHTKWKSELLARIDAVVRGPQ